MVRVSVIIEGGQPPAEFSEAQLRTGVLLGRGDGQRVADVLLDNDRVSRRHAELRLVGNVLRIEHLTATPNQKTIVDGQPLSKPGETAPLLNGSTIEITPFKLRIAIRPGAQVPAPVGGGDAQGNVPPAPAPSPQGSPPAAAPWPQPGGPGGIAPVPPVANGGAAGGTLSSTIRLSAPVSADADRIDPRTTTWPLGAAEAGRYLELLPVIFQAVEHSGENTFLGRYLTIFEEIWEPLEQRQDFIDLYFHPATCPEPMLDLMARWLGLTILPGTTLERRRGLVAQGSALNEQRGTRKGLRRAIELYTGLKDVEVIDTGDPFVFKVRAPRSGNVSPELLEAVIQMYKPAYAGYYLEWI